MIQECKESMIFYRAWKEAISGLPDKIRLEVYEAVIEYGTSGKLPELRETASVAFNFIKYGIDRDSEKYEATKNKRSEAGRKGGKQTQANQANVSKTKQSQANQANDSKAKQTQANQADNVNVNVNDNVAIINDSLNNKPSPNVEGSSPSKEGDPPEEDIGDEKVNYKALASYWNKLMRNKSISAITSINGQRRTLVRARIKEHGKDAFAKAMKKASESGFLNGNNKRNFICTFDWFIKPSNFPKVLEGNFANVDDTAEADFAHFEQEAKPVLTKNTKEKVAEDTRKFYEWCEANGKDSTSVDVQVEYFNLTKSK